MIPYVDLKAQHAGLKEEILSAVGRVLDHGWFILGPEVEQFEQAVADKLGARHVIGVNSGTDALLMALRLRGIGEGDEVITVSHSFIATASAIKMVGAKPVYVDIDPNTMLIDPNKIEEAITPRTRAVIPVHLGGVPCELDALVEVCERRGLSLIEDAAQCIGATYNGKAAGTFGIGCFSLHPLKVLGACGDAGMVVVSDDADAAELRKMRNIGLKDRDHCDMISGNSRLDALHAAILGVKFRHVDRFIAERRSHAAAYREAFAGRVRMPGVPQGADPVYSTFVVRHPQRDALRALMKERGVDCKIHYPLPIHHQAAFLAEARSLPVTDETVNTILSLPVTPELSVDGRSHVIQAMHESLDQLDA